MLLYIILNWERTEILVKLETQNGRFFSREFMKIVAAVSGTAAFGTTYLWTPPFVLPLHNIHIHGPVRANALIHSLIYLHCSCPVCRFIGYIKVLLNL